MTPRTLVEIFYNDVWNRADEARAREILSPDLRFRGSLGPEKRGASGFIDYMRAVHAALSEYRCIIDDIVVAEGRAAARMSFTGVHQSTFFGVPATGRWVVWSGAAFFTMNGRQITDLWVLGDIDSLKEQLGSPEGSAFA